MASDGTNKNGVADADEVQKLIDELNRAEEEGERDESSAETPPEALEPDDSVIPLPDESEPEVEDVPEADERPEAEEEHDAGDWADESVDEEERKEPIAPEEVPEPETDADGSDEDEVQNDDDKGEPAEREAVGERVGNLGGGDDGLEDDPEPNDVEHGGGNGSAQVGGLPATTNLTDEEKEKTDKDERFRAQMRSIDDEPKVAMFGFKSSGKSWLLHRLRRHLYRDLGAQLDPRLTELPESGANLPGTSEFELHEVIDKYPWSIIDSPGEYSKLLIEGKVENMWQLVHVLANSSAIIITIPADVLVFGSQMDELHNVDPLSAAERRIIAEDACGAGAGNPEIEAIEQFIKDLRADFLDLQNFGEGLYRAAGALSYVRHHGIDALDPAQYSQVTWEGSVKPHVKSEDFKPVGGLSGLGCPVYIALTKTDRLVSVLYGDHPIPDVDDVINKRKKEMLDWPKTKALRAIAERGDLLDDPRKYPLSRPSQFVKALENAVHTRFVRFCPMSHFDFVSAFFGHDYSDNLQFGHYRKYPEFGVASMQKWIQRAIALSEKGDKRISRQAFARQLHFAIHGIPQPGAASAKKYKRK